MSVLLEQGLAEAQDNILVHDAARCCLPAEALTRLLDEAGENDEGGILAIPVADTLKRADGSHHIDEPLHVQDYGRRKRRSFSDGLIKSSLIG